MCAALHSQARTQSVQKCIPTRSIGTIVTELSFLTLQRGNAVGDALRHRSAPCRTSRIGRGASHDAEDYEQPQQSGSSAV
ncbi:DUF1534 domain-containing protein [Pseudomonas syringae]|nr:DUF1534 domain-containing protein [Pseudomonas syringae]MCF5205898.1 DUF1534 domain-containing protein [Pseudomonas syringae]MCF5271197.1 DUF1534 domain-containing protein [Pseudomonas syringae]MCF5274833.1 DUF1534 domain-containing protein [Pseudomonas syringae]MCF5279171.1 DUF1534 domain-containing protein [Pseudomonas syringae]